MELIKLKDMRFTNRGNQGPRSELNRHISKIKMITNNPLKDPANRMKQSIRMTGRKQIPRGCFIKGWKKKRALSQT